MAIDPIFGSQLPDLTSAVGAQASAQTPTNTPTVLTAQQLSSEAADVLLSDMTASSASASGDSRLSLLDPSATSRAFNSLASSSSSSGDPLLDDLNALDGGTQINSNSSINSALSEGLNSFLLQQATASFQASQAMDNQSPGSSSNGSILGNTSA